MRCLYPIFKPRRENGKFVGYDELPCGHCPACQENYKNDWAIRIKHELDCHEHSVFLTLTYDDVHLSLQNLEYDDGTYNSLQKNEVSLFLKRLRKLIAPRKVRFFASGEYGENFTERPHYHVLLFGIDKDDALFNGKQPVYRKGELKYHYVTNKSLWPHGHIEISHREPDAGSAKYITKYVAKKKGLSNLTEYSLKMIKPEFLLMSRRPGLGYDGIVAHAKFYATHPYGVLGKCKFKLPRYVVDKVDEVLDFDFKGALELSLSQRPVEVLTDNQKRQKEKNIAKKNNWHSVGTTSSGFVRG